MKNETKAKQMQKNHNLISAVIVTLVLLIGLSLLLYPTVADYINSLNYKKNINDYQQEVEQMDDSTRQEMLEAAYSWNSELIKSSSGMRELSAEMRRRYLSLLDPSETGMMGYIEIKKINVYLPIYHGTNESVLHSGIGHLEGSSLPVGGKGTHALLSGHSGLPSSKLFSNIDQLKKGDTFELHILGKVLTYKVESSIVVLPEEAEKQEFDPENDLCTLMTCTPYGVNTHRLLVKGVRIETPQPDLPDVSQPIEKFTDPISPIFWVTVIGLPLLLILAIVFIIRRVRRKK